MNNQMHSAATRYSVRHFPPFFGNQFSQKLGLLALVALAICPAASGQNLSGYWQGVAYQPVGGSTECYPVTIYLVQTGSALTGTSHTYIEGTPYFAEMSVSGTVAGNQVKYRETAITDKFDAPGFEWCLGFGDLTYLSATETLKGTLHGTTESGLPCQDAMLEVYRLQILSPFEFCQPGLQTLTVQGQNVKWYSDASLQTQLGIGNALTLDLQQTTTFFVTQTTQFCSTPSPAAELQAVISNLALNLAATQPTCTAAGSIAADASGGKGPFEFALNSGAFQLSGNFSNLAPGQHTVRIRDANGCERSQNIALAAPPPPSISLVVKPADCSLHNGAATATASGNAPFQYRWSTGSNAQTIDNLPVGVYTVTIADAAGCSASALANITNASSAPLLSLKARPTSCGQPNGRVTAEIFGGSQPYAFKWNTGAFTKDLADAPAGTYSLIATDINGCADTAFAEILGSPLLLVNFLADTLTIGYGESAVLFPEINRPDSLIARAEWSPAAGLTCENCRQTIASPTEPTTYIVTIEDTEGCASTASVVVALRQPDYLSVFVPNIFSPNDDGVNDRFEVFLSEGLTYGRMQVFDRWGNLVFESERPDEAWDGKHRGRARPSEVYAYIFTYLENWQKLTRTRTGNVTVVKF